MNVILVKLYLFQIICNKMLNQLFLAEQTPLCSLWSECLAWLKEMAPNPLNCPVPTCEYVTPATLPNYDTVYRDLELHTRYAHHDLQVAPPQQQQHGGGGGGAGPKPDRLPRPTIGEGSTDSDWVYFTDQWERYKRSTKLDGQGAVDQLWACCSEELARAVYDSGAELQ